MTNETTGEVDIAAAYQKLNEADRQAKAIEDQLDALESKLAGFLEAYGGDDEESSSAENGGGVEDGEGNSDEIKKEGDKEGEK